MDPWHEQKWVAAVQRGDTKPLEYLIKQYTPMVQKCVNKYRRFASYSEERDLLQDGFEIIIKSLYTYRPQHSSLSTYLYRRIQYALITPVTRYQSAVYLPVNAVREQVKQQKEDYTPTDDSVMSVSGGVAHLKSYRYLSLNRPLQEGTDAFLEIPSDNLWYDSSEALDRVRPLWRTELAKLPERTQKILKLVYEQGWSRVDTGQEIGVSRERIRQICMASFPPIVDSIRNQLQIETNVPVNV